jgi:hypothetical protein
MKILLGLLVLFGSCVDISKVVDFDCNDKGQCDAGSRGGGSTGGGMNGTGGSVASGGVGGTIDDGGSVSTGGGTMSTDSGVPIDAGSVLGFACSSSIQCNGLSCVEGVCCESACNAGPCQSCLRARTGQDSGICTLVSKSVTCRDAGNICDIEEKCTGDDVACPIDEFEPATSLKCAPNKCPGNGIACTTSCSSNADCSVGPRTICHLGSCVFGRMVFLSERKTSNFGVAAINALCINQARDAGLGENFIPWISTLNPYKDPRMTLSNGTRPFIRFDKVVVAESKDEIFDSGMRTAIKFGVRGTEGAEASVHTGTYPAGYAGQTCEDWTYQGMGFLGTIGNGNAAGGTWTTSNDGKCDGENHFYCFEN